MSNTTTTNNLQHAVREYLNRRDRITNPNGEFDRAGRWYPSEAEFCDCCNAIRSPSRAYPYSFMTHCRTAQHVANLYGVDVKDLRRAARAAERASA